MHFFLFLFSYALNPLIIFRAPDSETEVFLTLYATFSIVFSLLLTVVFSNKFCIKHLKIAINIILIFLIPIILLGDKSQLIWILYPLSLLLGDYICTQSASPRVSIIFRVILILTALPFLFPSLDFTIWLIVRMVMCFMFIIIINIKVNKYKILDIKSPIKWIFTTYFFYSGALLVTPYLSSGSPTSIKVWFITLQVGLGLILKQLDFSVRSIKNRNVFLLKTIDIVVILLPLSVLFFYFDLVMFIVYMISLIALYQLKPKK